MIDLKAKLVNEKLRNSIARRVQKFKDLSGRSPKLSVILVGEDPASVVYTNKKGESAQKLGMEHETFRFPTTTSPEEVYKKVEELNHDPHVDGILIQRPLPSSYIEDEVVYWIDPKKDVDAFHPENTGRLVLGLECFKPCTPAGVMELLKHYDISPAGKLACVIGRSPIVGKPMHALLLQANATVVHCHSRTKNLKELTRQADIVVAAAGRPKLFGADYFKDGAVVVDVGIHRMENGKLCGDVDPEGLDQKLSALTPVPGGVGPMTITILLENTVASAERSL